MLDLVDTHSTIPPKMEIKINDISFVRELPKGAGDASAHGQPDKGRECQLAIDFPVGALKMGTNNINITSLEGSWVLYDQVAMTVPSGFEAGPVESQTKFLNVHGQPYLIRHDDGKMYQPVLVSVLHIGQPAEAVVEINGVESARQSLKPGYKVIEGFAPAVQKPTSVQIDTKVAGKSIGKQTLTIKPVRKWEIYILHHSHVDIGYTHVMLAWPGSSCCHTTSPPAPSTSGSTGPMRSWQGRERRGT